MSPNTCLKNDLIYNIDINKINKLKSFFNVNKLNLSSFWTTTLLFNFDTNLNPDRSKYNLINSFEFIFLFKDKYEYELIFVNDGSRDESWSVLQTLAKEYKSLKGLVIDLTEYQFNDNNLNGTPKNFPDGELSYADYKQKLVQSELANKFMNSLA